MATGISVLTVRGALDIRTAPVLTQAVDHAMVSKGPRALIIDMTAVDFLGSAGITALFSAHEKLQTITRLAVVAEGPATSGVLEIVGLDSTLLMFSTLDLALGECGDRPE
jgi:anti-sigma B factor antagonist